MSKKTIRNILAIALLSLAGAAGCGDSSQTSETGKGSNLGGPNVGNLPPPSSLEATSFFENKALYDSLSPEFQKTLLDNEQRMLRRLAGDETAIDTVHALGIGNFSPSRFFQALTGGCSPISSFICVDTPQDKVGVDGDELIVAGAIDICQVAKGSAEDPEMFISFAKEKGSVTSISLTKADFTPPIPATAKCPTDLKTLPHLIGEFSKKITLSGEGRYLVSISSVKRDAGNSASPFSADRNVIRQGAADVKWQSFVPGGEGNLYYDDATKRKASLCEGDVCKGTLSSPAAMTSVVANIEYSSVGTYYSVKIGNYDSESSTTPRYVTFGDGVSNLNGKNILPATLKLFPGKNVIKAEIGGKGTGFKTLPAVVINNSDPRLEVKMISPTEKLIESDQKTAINLQFCLTNSPVTEASPKGSPRGECIKNWKGPKPVLKFNGLNLSSQLQYDPSTGVFSASALPYFGNNIITVNASVFEIIKDGRSVPMVVTNQTTSFAYGLSHRANGDRMDFLKRGVSLQIGPKVIKEDLKNFVSGLLSAPSFKDTFKGVFESSSAPTFARCSLSKDPVVDDGTTKLDLLDHPEFGPFQIGSLAIDEWQVVNGRLNISLSVNGFKGEADIVTDSSAGMLIPVTFGINQLQVNLAVRFEKDQKSGVNKLVIEKRDGKELVKVVADPNFDPLGRFLKVSAKKRNIPSAAVWETRVGTLQSQVVNSIEANLLCFTPNKINSSGGLAQWVNDTRLFNDSDPNKQNPFKQEIPLELLGQKKSLGVNYDVLKADEITFTQEGGLKISNIPLRFTAGQKTLELLKSKNLLNTVYSLINPSSQGLTLPSNGKDFALALSEDAINQALAAANQEGLLNIDIDSEFYVKNGISFISDFTPRLTDLFPELKIDVNGDGYDNDQELPLQMSLRTDPAFPPHVHFLSQDEVNEVRGLIEKNDPNKKINPNLPYARVSLTNAMIEIYPREAQENGYEIYCDHKVKPVDPVETRSAIPPLNEGSSDPMIISRESHGQSQSSSFFFYCGPSGDPAKNSLENVPVRLKPLVPGTPPLVTIRLNLSLYLAFQGVYHEQLPSDFYKVDSYGISIPERLPQDPPAKTFLRLKTLPTDYGTKDGQDGLFAPLVYDMQVVDNRTPFQDYNSSAPTKDFQYRFKTAFKSVFGLDGVNEFRISIPSRVPGDMHTAEGEVNVLSADWGLDSINLIAGDGTLPNVTLGSDRISLDLESPLTICSLGNRGTQICPIILKKGDFGL